MSLHVESPLSDSKMDISEATTSLESAGVSPIAEDDVADATKTQPLSPSPTNHNDHHANINAPTERQNEDDVDLDTGKTAAVGVCNSHLDNRKMRPEVLALEVPSAQRQHIARTLANSHPLMSSTDSESEQQYGVAPASTAAPTTMADDLKCHNFPDVVPHYEHIQPPLPPTAVAISVRNTLNTMRGKVMVAVPAHSKLTLLRAHSPDLLSSESEADVSQYAAVEANFQAVALMPANNSSASRVARRAVRKVAAGAGGGGGGDVATGCDDISSLDSISNHSFDDDEDLEHNLASLSPSSSLIDGLDDDDSDDAPGADDDDDFAEATTPTPNERNGLPSSTEQLPQYTAAEERRDSRNWQKITLPDGHTREIDMRVIEPYKRVLSHGGYLKAGGHNAIVIFCACHLPDRSRADYNYVMDNLFLYVVKTLEQLVTEDYVLIYLHGGTSRRNVPPFPWLKKCYQLLDRRLRKSLKNMYLVHPTFWIKSIVWMARPFVSTKFWRKLIYVKSLDELGEHVTVEKAAIPEKVKQYDARHN